MLIPLLQPLNEKKNLGLIIDTYWCGSGNVSSGPYELGPNHEIDICYMVHDFCPIFIKPGEEKYERINVKTVLRTSRHGVKLFHFIGESSIKNSTIV